MYMDGAGVQPVSDDYRICMESEQPCMESLTITKWRCHFRANKVIADVRVSCICLTMVYFNYYER